MATGIGIDLGGTELKSVACALPSGELLAQRTAPTRDGEQIDGEPAFLAGARELVAGFEAEFGKAERIGVAAPGLADRSGKEIRFMPGRLGGLEGLPWAQALDRERVPVLNDAQSALLGEIWQGAAAGRDDVVMLTLGTGVGGAIVSAGQLLRGAIGRAGHLGHISVDFEGGPDICATPGSLEDAIGNHNLAQRCEGKFTSTHELVAAFAAGDPYASEVWLRSLRALAAAIVSLGNAVDPSSVIIGGGIASAGDQLFGPLGKLVREREWRPAGAQIEILPAQLGQWAGAYGALYNALA